MGKKTKWFLFLSLVFLTFFTRFYNLSNPPNVVFDEAHFALYSTKYLSGEYYYDIHPPLGKLILSLINFIFAGKTDFQFKVGEKYEDFNFLPARATIAFFGSLFILLIYFLARECGFSERAAFLASFLILFDNSFLVQSRFILLDMILIFFVFLSFYFLIIERRNPPFSKKWFLFNFLFGITAGLAISTKWTGFGIFLLWILSFFLEREKVLINKRYFLFKFILNIGVPILLYFLFFFVHFSLLPKSCSSKCGAVLEEPQKNLSLFNSSPTGNFFEKLIKVHLQMLGGNLIGPQIFLYDSPWYSFPFMIRPILYFKEVKEKVGQILFFGNPLVWWLGFFGIITYLFIIVRHLVNHFFSKRCFSLSQEFLSPNFVFLLAGYFLFFLPLSVIQRYVLPYHYLIPLTFAILIFSRVLDLILNSFLSFKIQSLIIFILLMLVFSSFVYFLPFTYNLPLSQKEMVKRFWLPTWDPQLETFVIGGLIKSF